MPSRSARERAEREARRRTRAYSIRQTVFADRLRRRRRDDVIAAVVLVVVLVLATTAQVLFFTAGPGAPKPSPSTTATATPTPTPTPTRTLPPKSLSGDRTWTGSMTLNSTKLGITLNGRKAPQAVANFVALTRSGFYAHVPCHRLTASNDLYVLQCGDPTGTGSGGPGYSFGPIENAPKSGTYTAGVIAMARTDAADSQGSQFFIVYRTSHLTPTPGYTVFGSVTSGLSALKAAITSKGVATDGTAPKVATTITALTVR